jgi:hypothetical protein
MSQQIVALMHAPPEKRDLPWLQSALQAALELELATLPPYLCALWALDDPSRTSYPATQIHNIALQEMAHFGLACNMLRAVGTKPDVFGGYDQIEYPGQLPGGVRPKCDPKFFPCHQTFDVVLGFSNFQTFALMAMQIEYPELPVPKPALLALEPGETFPSIGEFYDAVVIGFQNLKKDFPYDKTKQIQGPLGIFIVDGMDAAVRAIRQIQQQGEGASKSPYYAPNQLSHFYAFGELYFAKKYAYNPATQTGYWTGDKIDIPNVFPMTPVPKGGYTNPPQEVTTCDQIFTAMLQQLDDAWAQGDSVILGKAITSMRALRTSATALLAKQIPRTGGPGIFGPQFRKV